MKIKSISVKNFRGIDVLEKLSCGQINSYVGKNDSGKSTILKALDAFFNKVISPKDIFQGILEGEEVSISLQFEPTCDIHRLALDRDECVHIIRSYKFNDRGRLNVEEYYVCLDHNNEFENCWGVKEDTLNEYCERLGLDYSRSGRGYTNLSKIEMISDALEGEQKVEKIHPVGDLLKSLAKYYEEFEFPSFSIFDAEINLNEDTTNFQKQFKPIALRSIEENQDLTDQLEENVRGDLEKEFEIITNLMRKNVPELERINTEVVCNWGALVKFGLSLKFQNDNFDIPLSHKGTGFKRLLMVAYFEYLAQKNNVKYHYFGIEEPETYLHPQLQMDLLESIRQLAVDNQFFITTHSPIYAGATNNGNICVVTKEHQRSKYKIPGSRAETLDTVISELGIRPNHNLLNDNIEKVVFVEGSGDCEFWTEVFNKLNGGLPNSILFVPCGGSQVEYFVNADLCKKINRRFFVLLDSDKGATDYASKQANQAQLKAQVIADGGTFDMLRKREIENYYHIDAINRVLQAQQKPPTTMVMSDYGDIPAEVKVHIVPTGANFKKKTNMDVFREMTPQEWRQAAVQEGGITDLEIIINRIVNE